jgi:hypothetical protein
MLAVRDRETSLEQTAWRQTWFSTEFSRLTYGQLPLPRCRKVTRSDSCSVSAVETAYQSTSPGVSVPLTVLPSLRALAVAIVSFGSTSVPSANLGSSRTPTVLPLGAGTAANAGPFDIFVCFSGTKIGTARNTAPMRKTRSPAELAWTFIPKSSIRAASPAGCGRNISHRPAKANMPPASMRARSFAPSSATICMAPPFG